MRLLGTVPAGTMRSNAVHFHPGDVLYGRLRPYLNKVFRPDFQGLCSAEFIVLPETPAISGGFLKYRLNSPDFVFFASHLNEGDRPRVDFDQIKRFEVLLPPANEQRRIVEKIEELLTDLEAGVAALERVQRNLKRYRASVLKAAVEGRLTEKWRAAHPDVEPAEKLLARILAERRRRWEADQLAKFQAAGKRPPKGWQSRYKEPAAPDTSALPALPPGWCWASMDQVLAFGNYGTSVKCEYKARGVPVLRIPNIQRGEIDLGDMKFATQDIGDLGDSALKPGDILVCRTNGSIDLIGKAAVVRSEFQVPHYFASYLIRLRLVSPHLPEYVHSVFASAFGRRFIETHAASSAGQHNISLTALCQFPIPLPPLDEQSEILARVELRAAAVVVTEEAAAKQLQRTGRLRQSILKRAFEGRLVPQDPADEPAEALLARIKADGKAHATKHPVSGRSRQGVLRPARGQA